MTSPVDWDRVTVAGAEAVSLHRLIRCTACNREIMHAKGRECRICPACGAEIEDKPEQTK